MTGSEGPKIFRGTDSNSTLVVTPPSKPQRRPTIIYPVLEITIEAADDKTNEQVWIGLICFLVTLIVAMTIGAIVCWKKCSRRTNGQDDGIEMVAF